MSRYREHPLTQQDIIDRLEKDYYFTMKRKAVKGNLLVLEEAGIGMEYLKKGCYLDGRTFENPELRLLIDSILCHKHQYQGKPIDNKALWPSVQALH